MPLVGLTKDSPDLEIFVNFGFDIGPGNADSGGLFVPTGTRSR